MLSHNESDNSMKPRANDAIYLRPTGCENGGFFVFDLKTERRVHRMNATGAHMPQSIITKVETIAKEQEAPVGIVFGGLDGSTTINDIEVKDIPSDDDASDATYEEEDNISVETDLTGVTDEESLSEESTQGTGRYHPRATNDDETGNDRDDEAELEDHRPGNNTESQVDTRNGTDLAVNDSGALADGNPGVNAEEEQIGDPDDDGDDLDGPESSGVEASVEGASGVQSAKPGSTVELDQVTTAGSESAATNATNPTPPPERRQRGLRPIVTRTHNKFGSSEGFHPSTHRRCLFTAGYGAALQQLEREHAEVILVSNAIEQYNNLETSQITPQYGVQKGLKIFGDAGVEAVLKELRQLHDRNVISPVHPRDMTAEDIK